jgi:hypothetical protein
MTRFRWALTARQGGRQIGAASSRTDFFFGDAQSVSVSSADSIVGNACWVYYLH